MILHIDDDICFLRVIPHMLKMQNIKVDTVNQVGDAKNWLTENTDCDVIILNLHMRDGEGLEMLNWLESQSHKATIIILDNPNRDNYQDIQKAHNYTVLSVPFNGEDLLKILQKL